MESSNSDGITISAHQTSLMEKTTGSPRPVSPACAEHAIAVDPELTFIPYLLGIYLLTLSTEFEVRSFEKNKKILPFSSYSFFFFFFFLCLPVGKEKE
ncbi:hypothetical protein SODALDRAFT_133476 [Sodiomyces alkalinus F11]|uniref:Uncharacterized protein n=1 Tax=Sodiomyces alkalinus (strain CBS 110278 / VKM F-3762 / F11) TaxID=1314773 RepID=A0A3N2PYK5_SODAK|nr:hypothetical protein SODALDRAFT_133476 [Sodiomyces alkalinus F11]ROT39587.1 hypothetical protein SODALDRAFT_133476 [Sodiomyces alkalinus F11]